MFFEFTGWRVSLIWFKKESIYWILRYPPYRIPENHTWSWYSRWGLGFNNPNTHTRTRTHTHIWHFFSVFEVYSNARGRWIRDWWVVFSSSPITSARKHVQPPESHSFENYLIFCCRFDCGVFTCAYLLHAALQGMEDMLGINQVLTPVAFCIVFILVVAGSC